MSTVASLAWSFVVAVGVSVSHRQDLQRQASGRCASWGAFQVFAEDLPLDPRLRFQFFAGGLGLPVGDVHALFFGDDDPGAACSLAAFPVDGLLGFFAGDLDELLVGGADIMGDFYLFDFVFAGDAAPGGVVDALAVGLVVETAEARFVVDAGVFGAALLAGAFFAAAVPAGVADAAAFGAVAAECVGAAGAARRRLRLRGL